jgi:hypothetical protein
MNFINTLDHIYTISSQEYYNVSLEQLEQSRCEPTRKSRLEILNQMDEEYKETLRKKEYLTYSIRKKAHDTSLSDLKTPQIRSPKHSSTNLPQH